MYARRLHVLNWPHSDWAKAEILEGNWNNYWNITATLIEECQDRKLFCKHPKLHCWNLALSGTTKMLICFIKQFWDQTNPLVTILTLSFQISYQESVWFLTWVFTTMLLQVKTAGMINLGSYLQSPWSNKGQTCDHMVTRSYLLTNTYFLTYFLAYL